MKYLSRLVVLAIPFGVIWLIHYFFVAPRVHVIVDAIPVKLPIKSPGPTEKLILHLFMDQLALKGAEASGLITQVQRTSDSQVLIYLDQNKQPHITSWDFSQLVEWYILHNQKAVSWIMQLKGAAACQRSPQDCQKVLGIEILNNYRLRLDFEGAVLPKDLHKWFAQPGFFAFKNAEKSETELDVCSDNRIMDQVKIAQCSESELVVFKDGTQWRFVVKKPWWIFWDFYSPEEALNTLRAQSQM